MKVSAKPEADRGFILVNVLAVVAITSAVVVTMLLIGDIGIRRSQRFGNAAQAMAWSMGAETSAIIVLRRDGEFAPEADSLDEPWANLAQQKVSIANGTFVLAIQDAQSQFNVNSLLTGGKAALETARKICVALNLEPDIADRLDALVRFTGPVTEMDQLRLTGLDEAAISELSTMVTALPVKTDVNINTVGQPLLGVLLGNPVAAQFLIARRDRSGFLDQNDLSATGIILPSGLGFTSNYFKVTTTVTVDDTTQTLTSLLERRKRAGKVEVLSISRKRS